MLPMTRQYMELRESTKKKTLQTQTKLKVKQTTIEDSLHNQTNNLEKKTPLGHTLEDSREQEEFAPLISSVNNMVQWFYCLLTKKTVAPSSKR